jgi:hypothetical protein
MSVLEIVSVAACGPTVRVRLDGVVDGLAGPNTENILD